MFSRALCLVLISIHWPSSHVNSSSAHPVSFTVKLYGFPLLQPKQCLRCKSKANCFVNSYHHSVQAIDFCQAKLHVNWSLRLHLDSSPFQMWTVPILQLEHCERFWKMWSRHSKEDWHLWNGYFVESNTNQCMRPCRVLSAVDTLDFSCYNCSMKGFLNNIAKA